MNPLLSLCWKEYREQRLFWLAILVLGYGLVLSVGWALAPAGLASISSDQTLRHSLLSLLLILIGAYAIACSGMLFAGERENGTEPFLDRLAFRRGDLWFIKVALGLFLSLTLAGALAALGAQLRLLQDDRQIGQWWFFALLLGADSYAWGLVASVLTGSVLGTAVLTCVLWAGAWAITFLLFPVIGGGIVLVRPGLSLLAMGISFWLYTAPDRARRPRAVPVRAREGRRAWKALLWLGWYQGRWAIAILLGFSVLAGVFIAERGIWLFWPVASLLLGLACGVQVFADEQVQRTNRFLGEQRIPPNQLWLGKVGFWLGALLVCWLVLLLIGLGGLALKVWARAGADPRAIGEAYDRALGGEGIPVINPVLFLLLWPVYGFSIGLVAGQLFRKPIVAGLIGLMVSGFLAAAWAPSILLGGLAIWPVFVLPLLLIGVSWLVMRPWLGERHLTWRPLLAVVLPFVLGVAWNAGALWLRMNEIPEMGQPFDIQAFRQRLDRLHEGNVGEKMQAAVQLMNEQQKEVTAKLGQPTRPIVFPNPEEEFPGDVPPREGPVEGGGPPPGASAAGGAPEGAPGPELLPDESRPPLRYDELLSTLVEHGRWSRDAFEVGRWLDALFARSWVDEMKAAASLPPGLLRDPRLPGPRGNDWLQELRTAALLLTGRALQLEARGEAEAALAQLLTCLDLSKHLDQPQGLIPYLIGQAVEAQALQGLLRWQQHPAVTPPLLHKALRHLRQHEKTIPPLVDQLRVEWFLFDQQREQLWPRTGRTPLVKRALNVPWEKERQERMVNFVWHQALSQFDPAVEEGTPSKQQKKRPVEVLDVTAPPGFSEQGWQRVLRETAASTGWPFAVSVHSHSLQRVKDRTAYQRAVVSLNLAARLFRLEHNRVPQEVGELAPRYLETIPVNPQTGLPFSTIPSKLEENQN